MKDYDAGVPTLFPLLAQSWAFLMGPKWALHGPKWAPSKFFLTFSICSVGSLKPKNNYLVIVATK